MSYASDYLELNGPKVIERLKAELYRNSLSQSALSRMTGISTSQISRIMKGHFEFLTDGFWVKLKKCQYINVRWIKYGI